MITTSDSSFRCEGLHSPLTRTVAKVFRFVIPGHVMTSLLLLGLEATNRLNNNQRFWAMFEARTFEVILPVVAACFVFLCIPNQMKNYLASGLVFLAIGIVRLEQNWFQNRAAWPIALLNYCQSPDVNGHQLRGHARHGYPLAPA